MGAVANFINNIGAVLGTNRGTSLVRHHNGLTMDAVLDSATQLIQRESTGQNLDNEQEVTVVFQNGSDEEPDLINTAIGLEWNAAGYFENTGTQPVILKAGANIGFEGAPGNGSRRVKIQLLDNQNTLLSDLVREAEGAVNDGDSLVQVATRSFRLEPGQRVRVRAYSNTTLADSNVAAGSWFELEAKLTGTTPDLSQYQTKAEAQAALAIKKNWYDDLAALKAGTGHVAGDYAQTVCEGVVTPVKARAATAANELDVIASTGSPAIEWVVQEHEAGHVVPEMYGCVGDGVSDDTAAYKLCVGSAKDVVHKKGSTYLLSDQVDVNNPQEIDLNGSTVNYSLSTLVAGYFAKSNGVKIKNGAVNVVGSQSTGGNGHALNCVTIGNQLTGEGYSDFEFSNLTVSTNRTDAGACVGVLGECTNGLIENITAPSSSTVRNVVGLEWGGNAGGSGNTGHPHNIKVNNIKCGSMTYPATYPSFGYGVWISSCFNIEVTNVYADEIYGLVGVYSGDKANDFAPDRYADQVGKGITVKNASCEKVNGAAITSIGKGNSTTTILDLPVQFKRVYAKAGNATAFGWAGEQFNGASLEKFSLDGFDRGVSLLAFADNARISKGVIKNCQRNGILVGTTSNKALAPKIEDVLLHDNNQANGSSLINSAIYLNNTRGGYVRGCVFGVEGEQETQKYSISMSADTRRPLLEGNHTFSVASGGFAYVIASSAATYIQARGDNNTAAAGVPLHAGAPIFRFMADGTKQATMAGIPAVGSYKQGDKVWFTAPASGGHIGAVCTASGTNSAATDSTGNTDGSTGKITGMTDTGDFHVGDFVTVSAGFPSAVTPYEIIEVTVDSITIEVTSNSAQSNVTVDTPAFLFNTFGAIS